MKPEPECVCTVRIDAPGSDFDRMIMHAQECEWMKWNESW